MSKNKVMAYLTILLGVLMLHIGFYFFLQPISLIIGGMMGLSLLMEPFIQLSVGTIYLILNLISLAIGAFVFGKEFFIRTVFATLVSPLLVFIFEQLNISPNLLIDLIDPQYQMLIASLAGGMLAGVGIGIVLRNNATTGGMDVYQKIAHKYLKIPFSVAVYATDGLIIIIGMFVDPSTAQVGFLINFQSGVFAMIAMLILAFMIEKTSVFGRNSLTLLIITDYPENIKEAIFSEIDRGLTRVLVTGGFSNQPKEMIISTIYRQDLVDMKQLIERVDPSAFTLILSTKEVIGNRFHRNDLL